MKINTEKHVYKFSKSAIVSTTVRSGTTITIETLDAFSNQIVDEHSTFDEIDMSAVNPATGVIYVEEAEVGDTLKVEIHSIELADQGVMAVAPNLGVLGDEVKSFQSKIMKVNDKGVQFNERITLPLRKMVGVIGVAPAGDDVSCGTPGDHGGNMDNTQMTEGATVYFPVATKGALFALGDVHAAMGDGEVCVTGVEIAANVTVKLSVEKRKVEMPWLENEHSVQVIASAQTFEEAIQKGVRAWCSRLETEGGLSFDEAMMLISASGNTEVCHAVNPQKTIRVVIDKDVLRQVGMA
ncbi:acetamidase/formamidase family protein [Bacillus sp. JCM 19041]|uniref:acetamidase/formamidase family protein n=1 Tax=Bacillus sp. JCM 19041 TaxID=1460637 RepID=UPI0006D1662C